MPGLLHWSEIVSSSDETLSPIQVALDSLTKKNADIQAIIESYRFVMITLGLS